MAATKAEIPLATKLQRITARSGANPGEKFGKLMPLFNKGNLLQCFHELKEDRATGIDKQTKEVYSINLGENIDKLIERMKAMSYYPLPVKEVLIPKDDGGKRPLGISVVEDKIIQLMYAKILEAIYEPHFCEGSFGFRPKRNCHQAIQGIINYLFTHWRPVIIDADVKNYFGTIEHKQLVEFLRKRIDDERFLRYLVRILKAGILSQEGFRSTDEGSPQGAICSPVLSNIYAHYVLDSWVEEVVKPRCHGVEIMRYADDFVICCPDQISAEKIYAALGKRLERFNLKLHETKTKLVVMDKRKYNLGERQGTFSFLGFTFYLGKSQKGHVIPKIQTDRKKFRSKVRTMKEWLRNRRNEDFNATWHLMTQKLTGHARYYGVSQNAHNVSRYIYLSKRLFFKWMNRRSQRRSFTWEKLMKYEKLYPTTKPIVYVPLFPGYSQRKI